MSKYTLRYSQYAKGHGFTEEEMLIRDREVWPGGCMVGFMLYVDAKLSQWAKEAYPNEKPWLSKNNQPVD